MVNYFLLKYKCKPKILRDGLRTHQVHDVLLLWITKQLDELKTADYQTRRFCLYSIKSILRTHPHSTDVSNQNSKRNEIIFVNLLGWDGRSFVWPFTEMHVSFRTCTHAFAMELSNWWHIITNNWSLTDCVASSFKNRPIYCCWRITEDGNWLRTKQSLIYLFPFRKATSNLRLWCELDLRNQIGCWNQSARKATFFASLLIPYRSYKRHLQVPVVIESIIYLCVIRCNILICCGFLAVLALGKPWNESEKVWSAPLLIHVLVHSIVNQYRLRQQHYKYLCTCTVHD